MSITKDFRIIDLDPVQEVVGRTIKRKKDRKLKTFSEAEVTFFKALFVLIDCLVPTCSGHQKFGLVTSENLPVIFKYHDYGEDAKYVAYKSPIVKPLRVPLDGDVLINGIKWGMTNPVAILSTTQGIFDCLFACLKLLTMTKNFCLECLMCHVNGLGRGLECFLKTILYHIIVYGRFTDKDFFNPVTRFEKGMNLKFCRVYWEHQSNMFKIACLLLKDKARESFGFQIPNLTIPEYPSDVKHGFHADPNILFLRHLNSISTIHATTHCACNDGKPVPISVYISLMRHNQRNGQCHMTLAQWNQEGTEYSDPLVNWSMMGPGTATPAITIPYINHCYPISLSCRKCNTRVNVHDIYVPKTTWLLMAELEQCLQKSSANVFATISTYTIGGVVFELKFILLYNTATGGFTSMHLINNQWYFFDDYTGGLFKRCNPDRVKYKDRINLRAFFIRKTNIDPHACLQNAFDRHQSSY